MWYSIKLCTLNIVFNKVTHVTEKGVSGLHGSYFYSYKRKYISMKVKLMIAVMIEM